MKRPLAYVTAAWYGGDSENAEQAARYCRAVYEAGFSPICPTLYLPLFLNDAIPEEHKSGIDMSRDLLRRSHVLVVCGHIIILIIMKNAIQELMSVNLSGREVRHKTLGLGIIENLNDRLIIIRFSNEKVSKFRFPDAFAQGFLATTDIELDQYVQNAMAAKKCDICGAKNLETAEIEGKRICQKCKVHHSATCSICGKVYIRSSAQFVSDYEYTHIKTEMCGTCAVQNSFRCSKCGHRYFNEYRAPETLWTDERALCEACFNMSNLTFSAYKEHSTIQHLSFFMDYGDTLYVLLGNDECYKHKSCPALIRLKLNNNEEIIVEGQYCTECRQVQITRNTCAKYSRYHEAMKCVLFLKGLDGVEDTYEEEPFEFRDRADESQLKRLGYSVAQSDSRTDAERQALLKSIISTNQVSKWYVIGQLKNLIRINGKKQANAVALKKWECDLEFVLKL